MSELTDNDKMTPTESFLEVIILQNQRLYDVVMAIAAKIDSEETAKILRLHDDGEFLCPPPFRVEK